MPLPKRFHRLFKQIPNVIEHWEKENIIGSRDFSPNGREYFPNKNAKWVTNDCLGKKENSSMKSIGIDIGTTTISGVVYEGVLTI